MVRRTVAEGGPITTMPTSSARCRSGVREHCASFSLHPDPHYLAFFLQGGELGDAIRRHGKGVHVDGDQVPPLQLYLNIMADL